MVKIGSMAIVMIATITIGRPSVRSVTRSHYSISSIDIDIPASININIIISNAITIAYFIISASASTSISASICCAVGDIRGFSISS